MPHTDNAVDAQFARLESTVVAFGVLSVTTGRDFGTSHADQRDVLATAMLRKNAKRKDGELHTRKLSVYSLDRACSK